MGLTSGVGCVGARSGPVGGLELFVNSLSETIFCDFGRILGGVGKPKWNPKSIFGRFFSMFFSSAISASIFGRF